MIGSGEAESRAVAGAVRDAIGQARLDAGVNLTGLLADIDSADSMDFRRLFMCWHLTRVLRPSLTEKLPAAMIRSVLDQKISLLRIVSPRGETGRVGSPPSEMHPHGETPVATTVDSDGAGTVGDQETIVPAMDLINVWYPGWGSPADSAGLSGFSDGAGGPLHRELCRANQCART